MILRAELVTQCARLDEVGPAWDRLWRECGGGSLFQSHGWVRAWWAARGQAEHAQLHIGLCWEGEALRAVIPCATRRHRGVRVLEWAAKECTDYCDALAGPLGQPALARDALAQAWQAVAHGGFRVAYLSHIRPDATVLRLAGLPSFTLRPGRRSDQTMQVRSHGLTGAEWFRTLNKKARNNHLRGKRIIAQTGAVSAQVATGADAARKLERMIVLKRDWLKTTGQQSRLLDDDARILRGLVACLQEQQALQLFSLDCDGDLVAGLISIVDGTQSKTFFSAFDPQFERASPGVARARRAAHVGVRPAPAGG